MLEGVQSNVAAARDHEAVRSVMTGYKLSQALYVAAKLEIADEVAAGTRNVDDLARATRTDTRSLHRLLRLLAAAGFFAEDDGGEFSLTGVGRLLISDAPYSDWAWILKEGELWWEAWSHLLECVQTGRPAFDLVHGKGLFEYLADVATSDVADRTVAALSSAGTDSQSHAILEAYDFGAFDSVVDVGGGNAVLLLAALGQHPDLRGVLFDLPYVVDVARSTGATDAFAARCELIGGSFFEAVPPGRDLYVLRSILHDWDDDRALTILENCRRAVPPHGRLLVIEVVASEEDGDTSRDDGLAVALRDVNLMVMTSGRKRAVAELRDLLSGAGFGVRRVIALETRFRIIEAVPTKEAGP